MYKVNEGASLCCKKGILGPGSVVTVDLVGGDEKSLDALVKKGVLVKAGKDDPSAEIKKEVAAKAAKEAEKLNKKKGK